MIPSTEHPHSVINPQRGSITPNNSPIINQINTLGDNILPIPHDYAPVSTMDKNSPSKQTPNQNSHVSMEVETYSYPLAAHKVFNAEKIPPPIRNNINLQNSFSSLIDLPGTNQDNFPSTSHVVINNLEQSMKRPKNTHSNHDTTMEEVNGYI